MICNNSTGFIQQDRTEISPTEIAELALTFPGLCIILNFFVRVEVFLLSFKR